MFQTHPQAPKTLNTTPNPAPEEPDQRALNLAACLELRDLGLALARAAATRALAAQEPQPEPQTPPTDPDLAFARHSRSVRQSIELWEKITQNAFARPQTRPQPHYHPLGGAETDPEDIDPPFWESDRNALHEAVATLTQDIPGDTLLADVEEILTRHPEHHLSTHFENLCRAYGITPDRSRLSPCIDWQFQPPDGVLPLLE